MKQRKLAIQAVTLSGILGLTLTPGWSQTKSGSSSTEPGSAASGSSGKSDSGTGMSSGAQSSAKSSGGQWKKDDIKKIQEALKEKGQDPGPADGVLGAQTQKALRSFQSANGLKATGRLDAETTKALGVEGGSSSSMGSSGGSSAGSSSMEKGSSSNMEKGSSAKGSSGGAPGTDSSSKSK